VRYVDPDGANQEGFIKRLFSFGDSEKAKEAQRYRVIVKGADAGNTSTVSVQDSTGKPDPSPTATKILSLLNDELK
jgi:outer membrane protein assembly factor BamC